MNHASFLSVGDESNLTLLNPDALNRHRSGENSIETSPEFIRKSYRFLVRFSSRATLYNRMGISYKKIMIMIKKKRRKDLAGNSSKLPGDPTMEIDKDRWFYKYIKVS